MIFPTLMGKSVGYANVAAYAEEWLRREKHFSADNLLLDPDTCQRMIDDMHATLGICWSYGGWLEDRSKLWNGSYITERNTGIHLGVDLNAPRGTLIESDQFLHCIRVDSDHPEPHGWGTRMIARVHGLPVALIFGHVENVRFRAHEDIYVGKVIAEVGSSAHNGGWYPHLHIQAVLMKDEESFLENLSQVDGYGSAEEIPALARKFPDPMRFVRIF